MNFEQVFKGLYENASNHIHVGAHLTILTAIRDVCKLVVKELTSWVRILESSSLKWDILSYLALLQISFMIARALFVSFTY